MKIAIDTFPAMVQRSGIGNYTYHLIKTFPQIAPEHTYYLFDNFYSHRHYNMARIAAHASNVERFFNIAKVPFPFVTVARILLNLRNKLSGHAATLEDAEIYLGTNYRGVFRAHLKTVITIHDMAHIYYPEATEAQSLLYLTHELPAAAHKATRIIADSQATRDDIVKHLQIPAGKITVVHLGVDATFKPMHDQRELQRVRQHYSLPGRFVLFIGNIQPRKNLERLLRAYARIEGGRIPHHLVLAGGIGWKNAGLKALIEELGISERVHFPGYIAAEDLPTLYNCADLFLFPSLYEGFGLPVLEAMACGVPVVATNTSSLPEVAGDAALLVDPFSVEAITQAMLLVLENETVRAACIRKGLQQAAKFTWEDCAAKTLAVLAEAASS
jgi:glycosyltransferase involved in cell wall biosynthesis